MLECWDRKNKEYVAIKIVRNVQKYRDAAMIEVCWRPLTIPFRASCEIWMTQVFKLRGGAWLFQKECKGAMDSVKYRI